MRGLLICNGPGLEDEYREVDPDDFDVKVAVNYAIRRIPCSPWPGTICWIPFGPSCWYRDIYRWDTVHVEWISKPGQDSQYMEQGDFPPFLVNNGISMFTAIHYLVCSGVKDIVGVGVNMRNWPGGKYNKNGQRSGDHLFAAAREIWDSYTEPDLERLGVSFMSDAFNTP